MIDTDKIDLSLQSNQNKISVSLAVFFSVEELESIDVNELKCIASQMATHPCGLMEYEKKFEDGKSIKIHCTIDTECIPNTHYTSILLNDFISYQSEFRCNPNIRNPEFIALIIKRAINFQKYKNFEDTFYNKQSIVRNFSDKVMQDIGNDITVYDDIKHKLLQIESLYDFSNNVTFSEEYKEYDVDYVKIIIEHINDDIVKFSYLNTINSKSDYCYFIRGHMGLDIVILAFDRCINKLKLDALNYEL